MATEYEWHESYCIGNAIIDQQHQKMLTLCAESMKCLESAGFEGCGKLPNAGRAY